jgi:hypothetical protein
MAIPPGGLTGSSEREARGVTYGAVILAESALPLEGVQEVLRGIRFTGWITPRREGWLVALGDPGDGVVADGRRGVIEVGGLLAEHTAAPVLAVRVRQDHQLGLVAWRGGEEVGRYCSDPSREPDADDDVLDSPIGAELAEVLAELYDRTDAAEELTELLEEELDPDSVHESERLRSILRLLGLPSWIVAAGALPKDIPTGPRARELVHLRAGATGSAGVVLSRALRPIRRRQHPPPVIADPPTGAGGFDEWMY